MAVKLRLTRSGAKKRPFYRVVAINSDARRDGRPLEFLGYYNPHANPAEVRLDNEKIRKWLAVGAEMSDTVRSLVKKNQQAQ
jgi:small subunit ribosomal protein S16